MKNKKDMFKPYEEAREKIALKLSQDIPFIDPYYYQYKIESTIKAETWANLMLDKYKEEFNNSLEYHNKNAKWEIIMY